tara:strand:+ start:7788 stop:8135 length:348 start_codon:yes stop_codon:yes gene_type:complete
MAQLHPLKTMLVFTDTEGNTYRPLLKNLAGIGKGTGEQTIMYFKPMKKTPGNAMTLDTVVVDHVGVASDEFGDEFMTSINAQNNYTGVVPVANDVTNTILVNGVPAVGVTITFGA